MIRANSEEATGRSVLLHAVSNVLQCLPGSESRTFHNLTMIKIEQRRINWKNKFSFLADKFIENKVRQSLKSQVFSSGNRSAYKASFYERSSNEFDNYPRQNTAIDYK